MTRPVDPLQIARRQVIALREALLPILREHYQVTSPEHVDDVVSDLMRRETGLAGNVLAAVEEGEDVTQPLLAALSEYDQAEPFNLEAIASRETVYAAFLRAYGHQVDFEQSGRGTGYSKSYIWANFADCGSGECERRRHFLRLRREMVAQGEPDPKIQAEIDVAQQRSQGFTTPIAARSGGHIRATQNNPPPAVKVGRR